MQKKSPSKIKIIATAVLIVLSWMAGHFVRPVVLIISKMKKESPLTLIIDHLNKIFRETVKTAGILSTPDAINTGAFEEIIRQAMIEENTGEEVVDDFNKNYNQILLQMLNKHKQKAFMRRSSTIPLVEIRKSIDSLKKGYTDGYNAKIKN